MEFGDVEEALQVLDSSIARLNWRLRPYARRRLETDVLALCTGLRPVVMVDYAGKMPELQEHLCKLMHLARKDSSMLLPLRVMVIEEMIYIIHLRGLAEHALPNPSLSSELIFVDLEQDPPKMMLQTDKNMVASEFTSIQKLFSSAFPLELQEHLIWGTSPQVTVAKAGSSKCKDDNLSWVDDPSGSETSECIDLSSCMKDTHVTIPTLNGWLLGYPVVYLFGKDHIDDAVYNLSTKSLRIYRILICRNRTSSKKPSEEELMGFSVPYELSMEREKEPWAEAFLALMMEKFSRCKHVWTDLRMEVSERHSQAIAL